MKLFHILMIFNLFLEMRENKDVGQGPQLEEGELLMSEFFCFIQKWNEIEL